MSAPRFPFMPIMNQSRRGRWLLPAALAGVCILWFWRRAEAPPAPALRDEKPAAGASPSEPFSGPRAQVTDAARLPSYQDFLDALTDKFPFGRERQSVLSEMLEGAPPEAVEALLRMTFGDENLNDLSHVLIERLATLAPGLALAFAHEQKFGIDPPWWHSVIGGLEDPLVALGDILALPGSDVRTQFIGHVALKIGLADPDAALHFALAEAPPEARGTAIVNAVAAAARRDHADGFELALFYAPEAGEPGLLRSVAADWAMNDYPAALARIEAMPAGDARQTALTGLAAVAIDRDFSNAWGLLAQVNDADARRALYLQAAKQFFLTDPNQAEAWLGSTGELNAADKAVVREFHAFATRR